MQSQKQQQNDGKGSDPKKITEADLHYVPRSRLADSEKIDLTKCTLNQLAYSLECMSKSIPRIYSQLITDRTVQILKCGTGAILDELVSRGDACSLKGEVHEIIPAMSATHTIVVEESKPTIVLNPQNKPVKMETISGHLVPSAMENKEKRCIYTTLVDALFFPITSKTMEQFQEISRSDAEAIGFPLNQAIGLIPKVKASRADFITANFKLLLKEGDGLAKDMAMDFPKSLVFDLKTGLFEFKGELSEVKLTEMAVFYRELAKHRKVRGTDKDARNVVSAGYYYGLDSRSMYSTAYITQDILALGAKINTKVLEISQPDSIINAYVISSLIASGWSIRVMVSSMYPERNVLEDGTFKEKRGVFSYFKYSGVYLRWCPIFETAPRVTQNKVQYPPNPHNVVNYSFGSVVTANAVPFCYQYINPLMKEMSKNYPGCTLHPTAHAHNGHVIVMRADFKSVPLDLQTYLKRCLLANAAKTFYVYTRKRFLEQDPYAHPVKLVLSNKVQVEKVEDLELSPGTEYVKLSYDLFAGTPVFNVNTKRTKEEVDEADYVPPRIVQERHRLREHYSNLTKLLSEVNDESIEKIRDQLEETAIAVEAIEEEIEHTHSRKDETSSIPDNEFAYTEELNQEFNDLFGDEDTLVEKPINTKASKKVLEDKTKVEKPGGKIG